MLRTPEGSSFQACAPLQYTLLSTAVLCGVTLSLPPLCFFLQYFDRNTQNPTALGRCGLLQKQEATNKMTGQVPLGTTTLATTTPWDNYPGDNYPGDNYPGDTYPGDTYPGDNYPGDKYLIGQLPHRTTTPLPIIVALKQASS